MPVYLPIGKFIGSHGVGGDLILQHTLGKRSDLSGIQALFVEERKDQFLPWFIEKAQPRSEEETLIKLEGIDSKEQAQKLARRAVWLAGADFQKKVSRSAPVKLLGYRIQEAERDLGEILELIEQPHQLLCRLQIEGKDVLIPLHEESLKRVDHKKRIVHVTLPEGLLDIYLQ
ncbi:MAG: ribosome maturation factor RimM [Bacteroidota bacterium]